MGLKEVLRESDGCGLLIEREVDLCFVLVLVEAMKGW